MLTNNFLWSAILVVFIFLSNFYYSQCNSITTNKNLDKNITNTQIFCENRNFSCIKNPNELLEYNKKETLFKTNYTKTSTSDDIKYNGEDDDTSPFNPLPFDYFQLTFEVDFMAKNDKYWYDVIGRFNKPYEKPITVFPAYGINLILGSHYFSISAGNINTDGGRLDSLKSRNNGWMLSLNYGYNIINRSITVSPIIGLRYYYNNHTISYVNENKTIEEWLVFPDLSIRSHQITGVIGLNINIPIYEITLLKISSGYSHNLHKYPWLYSGNISLRDVKSEQIKNYFISIGLGLGGLIR